MKLLFVLALAASLGDFAVGQAPVAAGPTTGAPAAASARTAASARATGTSARRLIEAATPAAQDSAPLQVSQPSARGPRHWLRWAIVATAAILGVIAIAAYRHNNHPCNTPSCGLP